MYTRTVIDEAGLNDWANSESPGLYLRMLREDALLLLRKGEIRGLEKVLPTQVWGRLKDDISHRRQLWKVIGQEDDSAAVSPEVFIGSVKSDASDTPYKCRLDEFEDAPPVHRRALVRSRQVSVLNREDFWQVCLAPVLDSLLESDATIKYFDPYAFLDAKYAMSGRNPRVVDGQGSTSGLAWLMEKIANHFESRVEKPTLQIFTETLTDKNFLADDIQKVLQKISDSANTSGLRVEVYVYSLGKSKLDRDIHEAIHSRSLVLRNQFRFTFNYGLKAANLRFDSETKSFKEKALDWWWAPEIDPHLRELYFKPFTNRTPDATFFLE